MASPNGKFERLRIDPLDDEGSRPMWSVMIPVYNCAQYLAEALASVLGQDPGPGRMQIEVVDDASERDDPKSVVERAGGARIGYHRNGKNQGPPATWNVCVRRARGELIHILHGDDYVGAGFYREIELAAEKHPEAVLFCTRAFVVDKQGGIESLSPRIPELEKGSRDASPFFHKHPIGTSSVVIRRAFYEGHGGYVESLIHTADWEMFITAISDAGGVIVNQPLTYCRYFPENHTNRLMTTAENVRDELRFSEIMSARFQAFSKKRHRARAAKQAAWQIEKFKVMGDRAAARANWAIWWQVSTPREKVRRLARRLVSVMK